MKTNKQRLLAMVKEVIETADIKKVDELLSTDKWVVLMSSTDKEKTLFAVGRID